MKKLTLLLLLVGYLSSFGQEKENLVIFKNTKNWPREIIKFPIDWAPNLKATGFEELLFSPNWSDIKSNQFWSLVIGWKIDADSFLTVKDIAQKFTSYFDGLMKPNHWSSNFPNPKVSFTKNKSKKNKHSYTGKMEFFDGFHSGKVITVNILASQYFCDKQQKTILVFRLSPKNEKHTIWKDLKDFELTKKECLYEK